MRTADVVIGAGFGDEGKGLITDALAAAAGGDCLVVRHNGGAQAGHTVVTPDGRRHVFSHVGSGALAGATTYLSRFFVANPILYLAERERLRDLGVDPVVHLDRDAPVSTPWDMLINQVAEAARGRHRHGSCGIGFGETVERQQDPRFALCAGDLEDRDGLRRRLDDIRRRYVPARFTALGVSPSEEQAELLRSDGLMARYLADVRRFLETVRQADIGVLRRARHVVFEGAQGLLLDQDRGWFPHVTRSHTGLRNAAALALEAGIERLEVTYVTRAYATRHGNGPLPHEIAGLPYPRVRDETNRPNAFQGTLRFARLDLDLLARSIATDLGDTPAGLAVDHRLAVTCLDQIDGTARFYHGSRMVAASPDALVAAARHATSATATSASYSPTRTTLSRHTGATLAGVSRLGRHQDDRHTRHNGSHRFADRSRHHAQLPELVGPQHDNADLAAS